MPKMSIYDQKIVDHIAQVIVDDPILFDYADKVAKLHSDTQNWTSKDWETKEDTAEYNMYYEILTYETRRLAAAAVRTKLKPHAMNQADDTVQVHIEKPTIMQEVK